jgi:hypothetical protein
LGLTTHRYVEALLRYLEGFCRRALPLYDADADLSAASDDFAAKWKANEIPGWSEDVQQEVTPSDGIWCAACAWRAAFVVARTRR